MQDLNKLYPIQVSQIHVIHRVPTQNFYVKSINLITSETFFFFLLGKMKKNMNTYKIIVVVPYVSYKHWAFFEYLYKTVLRGICCDRR